LDELMTRLRTTLGTIGLVLSVAALLAFLAIALGCWFAQGKLEHRSRLVFIRADTALASLGDRLRLAGDVIEATESNLRAMRPDDATDPGAKTAVKGLAAAAIRRGLRELPVGLERLRDEIGMAVAAVAAAHAMLEAAIEMTGDRPSRIEAERLAEGKERLEAAVRLIKTALEVLPKTPDEEKPLGADQARVINEALAAARDAAERLEGRLVETRSRTAQLHDEFTTWVRWGTVILCALSILGAAGQICLVRRIWTAMRGR
jgi:hypothetical protein